MNNITSLTKLHHEMIKLRERAEKAEGELAKAQAELQKLREQKPVAEAFIARGGVSLRYHQSLLDLAETGANIPRMMLYAAPVAAPAVPAPSVPTDEQIHTAYRVALGQSIRERDMPEIRKFAIALLQSAEGYSSQAQNEVRHD